MSVPKYRIAILTLVIGKDYRKNLSECLESKRKYADKHGYTYFEAGEEFWDQPRQVAWSKVKFWQHILKEYRENFDYFWISDADVLITNPDLKLEDHVIPLMPKSADIMWNRDACLNINSGNMIFRPTVWLNQFLEKVWDQTDAIYHIWWENKGMLDVIEADPVAASKIFLNDKHWVFNAYLGGRKGERLWEPQDFLVHFAGVYDGAKISDFVRQIKSGTVPRINWFPDEQ